MKNRISAWIVLGVITLMAGLGLAITNEVTKKPIADQAVAAEERAKKLVMPQADTFEEIVLEDSAIQQLFAAKAGDEIVGYVGKAAGTGYGGEMEVIAGVLPDGTITGINVGGASFSETPGLGAKAKDAAFTGQFAGKTSPVRLGDPGSSNAVEAITAATITSNTVLGSVNNIARQVKNYLNPEADKPAVAAEGTSYGGEAEGFVGTVYVVVTAKDDGTITSLTVGDERFNESENYGANAQLPDFTAQFAGKTLPLALEDIEGISGATVTTKAVVDAINLAYESKNVVSGAAGTVHTGEAAGFAGPNNPVHVEVTITAEGTISALKVGDERFNETENYGANALLPEFTGQFEGKALPVSMDGIEGISGATVTTQAVVDAINAAYTDWQATSGGATEPEGDVYAGEAVGFSGQNNPVYVEVTIKDDGTITALKVGDERFNETENYGAFALEEDFTGQFVGKSLPVGLEDIEAISGATLTTKAVLAAINTAYETKNIIKEGAAAPVPQPTAEPTPEPAALVVPEGALTASAEGFAGPVAVALTFDEAGKISFIKIGDENFQETANFGLKALDESFYGQFIGKLPPLSIKAADQAATESTIDGIAGATVTTKAVLSAVNQLHGQAFPQEEVAEEAPTAVVEGSEITVTKQGFMGPVTVKVTFHDDGSISKLTVGDEAFIETPGYGALMLEEAQTAQYTGKLPPLVLRAEGQERGQNTVENLRGLDTATSATKTAQAVVDAINEAYAIFLKSKEGAVVTMQGFMGPVSVKTVFNEDGTIREVTVQAEGFAETPGYGAAALEEGFGARFAGKQAPLSIRKAGEAMGDSLVDNLVNPDASTSATVTMQAIIDAINQAFEDRP